MREAKNGEDAADAEGGWLDWLEACGVTAITGVDTRTLVRHIRDQGAMRGGIFAAEVSAAEARERIAAEPSMAGADLARTVTPGEPIEFDGERAPHRRPRHRDQAFNNSSVPRAELPLDPTAVSHLRRRGARPRSRPRLPRQRPRRPGRARLRRRQRPRTGGQAARGRHLPRPPAALPGGGAGDVQAPLRPPRRQPPGQGPRGRARSTSPPRTTASPSARPTAARRSIPTSRCAGRPTSAPPSSPI